MQTLTYTLFFFPTAYFLINTMLLLYSMFIIFFKVDGILGSPISILFPIRHFTFDIVNFNIARSRKGCYSTIVDD